MIKAIIIKAAHTSCGYDESSLQTDGLDAKKEKSFVFRERGNLCWERKIMHQRKEILNHLVSAHKYIWWPQVLIKTRALEGQVRFMDHYLRLWGTQHVPYSILQPNINHILYYTYITTPLPHTYNAWRSYSRCAPLALGLCKWLVVSYWQLAPNILTLLLASIITCANSAHAGGWLALCPYVRTDVYYLRWVESNTMLPSLFLSSGCLLCKHAKVAEMWILFQSIVSVARSLSRPWTWWIGSVPAQMSGCCLAGALSWWRDRLLWVLVVLHWPFVFWEQPRGISSGWAFCVLAYWILLHRYLPSTMIFLQLRKVLLCSCAKLLWSCSLWIWISVGTVKLRLSAVCDLFWGLLGTGDLTCKRGRSERGTVNPDSVQSPRTKFPWIWST